MSIEKLKEQLDKDPSISDRDKKIMIRRAELSKRISDIFMNEKVDPAEAMRILIGMACSMGSKCEEKFRAIGFIHECIGEYYNFYETIQEQTKEKKDG